MSDRRISVLLVEDNTPDAHYVQMILPKMTHTIVHAASLALAHEEISRRTHFDVILLDLSLPDGKGLETFLSMKDVADSLPILILTGLDDEDTATRAVQLGAQDYILKKDINEFTLPRAVRYSIERKAVEEKSKRLAILEQREEFMATLTHDLKNPLIGTNRVLELMAEQAMGALSDEQADLLLQMRDSNKMLLSMIQNLIEVYRFEREIDFVRIENTNLLQIIESCLADIAPIAKNRNIELKTDFAEKIREVRADAHAIRRVVQNLLDNALKFTPRGGKIVLSVHPTNGTVDVDIHDTGPGIPEEEQKCLFQRFSQGRVGRKYTPGTGLGLYLCKQIMDAHKGAISCISEAGAGTTFKVTLPAV